MVKDLKYIIKRIIIGTGIAIALMCIKGNFMLQGHALTQAISSWQMPAQESSANNTDNSVIWYTNDTPFAMQGDGELLFTFSIYKLNGISTAPNVAPRFVRVHTGGDSYVCYIGSSTLENSTFNGGTYSAICPMHIESAGLTSVVVALQNNTQNDSSHYAVRFNGLFTWKRDTEYTLLDAINNKLGYMNNNDIINNNNSNTQNIINNQDSNTQDVINNQNSNTDKQIESQKVCNDRSLTLVNGGISTEGNNVNLANRKRTDYISVFSNTEYKVKSTSNVGVFIFEYDNNYNFIRYYPASFTSVPYTFTTGNNVSYLRILFNSSTVNSPVLSGCFNGNQAIVNSQQDINNTLNDDSGGEVSSSWFDEFRESSSTPVSDLLTMPITLLQAYLNGFSDTCRDMNLGSLYGSYIIIPCLNIESYLGSELWSLIDVLFTLFMLYNIGMLCVTIYEGITSLNDDMQFLYSPRHAGAGDTRVERYGDDY